MVKESANKIAKKEKIEEIKNLITNSSSMIIVDYRGLKVSEDTELRSNFRKSGVVYKVLKNRLVKIALEELGYSNFNKDLEETNAFAFATDDAVAPARIIYEAIAKFKKLKAKCGLLDGQYLNEADVKRLSELPSKEVLLAQLMGMLNAPVAALARALNAIAEKENA